MVPTRHLNRNISFMESSTVSQDPTDVGATILRLVSQLHGLWGETDIHNHGGGVAHSSPGHNSGTKVELGVGIILQGRVWGGRTVSHH